MSLDNLMILGMVVVLGLSVAGMYALNKAVDQSDS